MLGLVLVCCISSVLGHGGIVWPPTWQDGDHLSIEDVYSGQTNNYPAVRDPNTGRKIKSISQWLTDQAYIGGHGTEEFRGGPGEVTNFDEGGCGKKCQQNKVPWASPGKAPAFGGGCGVFGGNPYGSDAREIEFPNTATTGWLIGGVEEVAWASKAWHQGGYTYRLCKLPKEGKLGLTEECFQENILEFATDYTMIRKTGKDNLGKWQKYDQTDVSVGTNPEGSVWRPAGKHDASYIRKDKIVVPSHLKEGEYVLSFRWDGATNDGQVWLSCANVRLLK